MFSITTHVRQHLLAHIAHPTIADLFQRQAGPSPATSSSDVVVGKLVTPDTKFLFYRLFRVDTGCFLVMWLHYASFDS